MPNLIAVTCVNPELMTKAKALADKLELHFIENPQNKTLPYRYFLILTDHYLGLYKPNEGKTIPFYLDFLSGKMWYRSKQAGLRKELLARALGIHPRENPSIIDATAGLGRDSFILASLGYEITLLERSPIIHALLADALNRAKTNVEVAPIIQRMHLVHADAITWLATHPSDVVILDPMFPLRKKSASVKKDMVIMQELLGKDEDSERLLAAALTCATRRVVVKRPRMAANIANIQPNFSLPGKSSRFDIYLSGIPQPPSKKANG